MEKPFFVMMYHQNGQWAMPLVEDDEDSVAFYRTIKEAREVADNHPGCQAFGYEIFKMGTGD